MSGHEVEEEAERLLPSHTKRFNLSTPNASGNSGSGSGLVESHRLP